MQTGTNLFALTGTIILATLLFLSAPLAQCHAQSKLDKGLASFPHDSIL